MSLLVAVWGGRESLMWKEAGTASVFWLHTGLSRQWWEDEDPAAAGTASLVPDALRSSSSLWQMVPYRVASLPHPWGSRPENWRIPIVSWALIFHTTSPSLMTTDSARRYTSSYENSLSPEVSSGQIMQIPLHRTQFQLPSLASLLSDHVPVCATIF